MAGHRIDHLLAVAGERRPQVRGHREMAGLAVTARHRVVGDLAQHVLREPVAAVLGRQRVGRHQQHLAAQQLAEHHRTRRLVETTDRADRLGRERRAEHRRVGDHTPSHHVERVQPGREQRVQTVGHTELTDVADQAIPPLHRPYDITVDQRPDRLHRIQRDALRPAHDQRPIRRRDVRDQRVDQLVHRTAIERIERDRRPVPTRTEPRPALTELRASEHQHEHRQIAHPVDQMLHEIEQIRRSMMSVLDQDRHRLHRSQLLEEPPATSEQLLTRQHHAAVPTIGADTEQPTDPHPDELAIRLRPHIAGQPVTQLRGDGHRVVVLGDPQTLTDHLRQRPIHQTVAIRQTPTAMPPHPVGQPVDVFLELPTEPRLAHPRRARHHHQPRHTTLRRRMEQLAQSTHLRTPPRQRRLQTVDALHTPHARHHPHRPPQMLRFRLALERVSTLVVIADRVRRQPTRRPIHPHRPRRSGALDPRRRVHRVTRDHPLVRPPPS